MERFKMLGIVGTGLIGASLGMALRQRGLARAVVGVDVDAQAIAVARERGAIDWGGTQIQALEQADLVIIAVPPDSVAATALDVAKVMRRDGLLTDVASTKTGIVRALEERLPAHVRYIGGHPMVGSEGHGPRMADAALLAGRPFLLTPTERTDPAAVTIMTELVEQLDMQPVLLSPEDHDELVAQISHLPYLLAVAAIGAASERAIGVSGPAFAGLSRLASSPVELWTQICRGNRVAIKQAIGKFRKELDQLERALDGGEIAPLLERSHRRLRAEP